MSEQDSPDEVALVAIQLLPLEQDDVEDVAAIGIVADALREEASTLTNYRLVDTPLAEEGDRTRSPVEFFQLVTTILQTVHGTQDIAALLSASGLTALWLVLKQRRVKKVEVKVGDRSMVIQNADQHAVETSLHQFEELCKQASNTITPATQIEIKAFASRRGNAPGITQTPPPNQDKP